MSHHKPEAEDASNGQDASRGQDAAGAGRIGQQSKDPVDQRLTKELSATFPASDPLTVTRSERKQPSSAPSVEDTFKTYADTPREDDKSHAEQAAAATPTPRDAA